MRLTRVLSVVAVVFCAWLVSRPTEPSESVDAPIGLSDVHRAMLDDRAQTPADGREALAMCFAPGTNPALVEAFQNNFYGAEFQLAARWSSTANGGTGATGNPITLTYSFAPDGTSIPGGGGVPSGSSNLHVALNGVFASQTTWQNLYHQAFQRWSQLTGLTYVFEPNDDGAQLGSQPGVIGLRGDVRLAGMFIDGGGGILAYNNFPNNGDMVIDTGDVGTFSNPTGNYRIFRNTIGHEHGHGLGIAHVCPTNQTKLMEPFLSSAFDGPQQDDILAAQRLYGDPYENNDSLGQAHDLGSIAGLTQVLNASVDDDSDVDWYRFTTAGWNTATLTLRPTGTTYNQGPQAGGCGAGAPYSAISQSDLTIALHDGTGTQITSINAAPAGLNETLLAPLAPGTWHAVVTGAANTIQRYELDVVLAPTTPPAFSIDFSYGVPTSIVAGATHDVGIRTSDLSGTVDPTSGQLFASVDGGPFAASPLLHLGQETFAATLPAMACNATVEWYVSFDPAGGGTTISAPFGAPTATHSTVAVTGATTTVFEDQFETPNAGWIVQNSSGLTGGAWERGVPVGGGTRGDPAVAFGGSGACYLTQNAAGNTDVDNGSTTLVSPLIDLSAYSDATVSFAFWYDNDFGNNPGQDTFEMQVSSNAGAAWQTLESYNASVDAWVSRSFAVAQTTTLTASMRFRFIAQDPAGTGSVVEAGLDAFKIEVCIPGAPQPSLNGISEAAGTLPSPLLSVNDSTGGSDRRIDVTPGSPMRMIVNQPAGNPSPAGFAVFGFYGVSGMADPTVSAGVGPTAFPLCFFDPMNPALFVFADTLGGSLCGGGLSAAQAPWVLDLPAGVGTPIAVTLQGVIESGSSLDVTNALIVRIQ